MDAALSYVWYALGLGALVWAWYALPLEGLASLMILGLIPAFIARHKGLSFFGWWLYGTVVFIAALPHVLLATRNLKGIEAQQLAEGQQKCPFCAEIIKAEARVCRYCGRALSTEP